MKQLYSQLHLTIIYSQLYEFGLGDRSEVMVACMEILVQHGCLINGINEFANEMIA